MPFSSSVVWSTYAPMRISFFAWKCLGYDSHSRAAEKEVVNFVKWVLFLPRLEGSNKSLAFALF